MVKCEVVMRSALGNTITIESSDEVEAVAVKKASDDAKRLFDEVPCSYVGCRVLTFNDPATSTLRNEINRYING